MAFKYGPIGVACAMCVSVFVLHCGARTPLPDPSSRSDAGSPPPDASPSEAGPSDSSVATDASAEASADAGQDGGDADASTVRCLLQQGGEPKEVFTLADQDLHTPSMVVLHGGDPATAQLARVALQAVHSGIRLIAMTVHEPTAAGAQIDTNEPMLVGASSTYGHMVHAPAGIQELAVVWGPDGPGNVFRRVDIPSWTLGELVTVSQTGWTPVGLAAGKGVPNTQTGQYEGEGYGMTWQSGTGQPTSLAVLSSTGVVQVGPLWTSAPVSSESYESSIAWSGSTYLMASRFKTCAEGDPLCRERAVVISRLRVAPGSNSVEFVSSFEVGTPGWSPGYPTLDGVYLVWDEGTGASEESRVVHVAQLDQDGFPVGPDQVVSAAARPLARPFIGSTPSGRVVGWAEDGDTGLADEAFGHSALRIQVLSPELELEGELLNVAISRFGSMGKPAVVPLEYPRGVLIAWSARSQTTFRSAIYAQFLPCVE